MTDVAGIGATKAAKLADIGVTTVPELAALDLRRVPTIGISNEVLKKAKADARKKCHAAGIAYAKAPYAHGKARNGSSAQRTPEAAKPAPKTAGPRTAESSSARKGFFARLLKR